MPGIRVDDCIYDLGEGREKRYLVRVKRADRKEVTKTFALKRDAQRWRDAQRAGRGDESPTPTTVTFEEYARDWLEGRRHAKAHKTHGLVSAVMRNHAFPVIGPKRLSAVRRSDIQNLVNRMGHLSPVTVRNNYSWVASVFTTAVLDDLISKTPCAGVELPRDDRRDRKVVPIDTTDVRAITDGMAPAWQGAVVLGAGTGLRPGELFGLTVGAVDFLRRTVKVEQQVQTAKGGMYLCALKTKASYRTVPMSSRTAELLSLHLKSHPPTTLTLPWGPAPADDEADDRERVTADFLFGGLSPTRHGLTRAWHAATDGLVMAERSGWHALRHFYASALIAGGESIKTVQDRMGHKSAQETLDTYGHLWPGNEDTTRSIIDGTMGAIFDDGDEGDGLVGVPAL